MVQLFYCTLSGYTPGNRLKEGDRMEKTIGDLNFSASEGLNSMAFVTLFLFGHLSCNDSDLMR